MQDDPRKRPENSPDPGADAMDRAALALPAHVIGSGSLDRLVQTARGYARAAASEATLRAYATDWAEFGRWCRRKGIDPLIPAPEVVGLYLSDLASGTAGRARSVATLERRLAGLVWSYRQRGLTLDRQDRHIASILAGIRRTHGRPPKRKAAVLADDILAMVATLPHDLRGLRDRAMLLLGYAGGLRRSEITGLDAARETSPDGAGWVEILAPGALLTLRGKTGWREVEVGRGSSPHSCPVAALDRWMHFARIEDGPLFRPIAPTGHTPLPRRITDRHVARLVKRTVLAAGLRPDLPEADRLALFSGHSLRAGLATAAEVEERFVQAHLGHASAEMTRRYQRRRDRFKVNLTRAAGL
ncbi:MAG: tyrosine-type recombinase/integrase [Alkalilacustris sp.]